MLPLVDANVILRYLLNDDERQSPLAKAAIDGGCEATSEVIFEVVYVLHGHYGVDRKAISDALSTLMDIVFCARHDVIRAALQIYGECNLDIVDCILIAEHEVEGREIITFDKKMLKRIG